MADLKPYGDGKYPQLTDESGGTGSSKPYKDGASGSKPIPVADVQSKINTLLTTAQTEVDAVLANIENRSKSLEDNFGAKFISINGKGLDFVDVGSISHLKQTISTSITNTTATVANFFSTCQAGEDAINAQLAVLETNAAAYKKLEDEKTKLENEKSSIEAKKEEDRSTEEKSRLEKLPGEISDKETEMAEYKEVSDPWDCGQWQKA